MPLHSKIEIANGLLAVWKITEEVDELLEGISLSRDEQRIYAQFRNPKRQKEWLATRHLVKDVYDHCAILLYHDSGEPYFKKSSDKISISHSDEYVGILIHKQKRVGIDIENTNRDPERIARRFLSVREIRSIYRDGGKVKMKMLLYWCAKEAIFKLAEFSFLNFSKQIEVDHFKVGEEGSFDATLGNGRERIAFRLHYAFFENHVMVWAIA